MPIDPRQIPENQKDGTTFARWVKTEAKRLRDEEGGGNLQLQAQMLETWEAHRPKMMARLERWGLAEDLALVLDAKMGDAMMRYVRAGNPDARALAYQEWLLMEPEDEDQA